MNMSTMNKKKWPLKTSNDVLVFFWNVKKEKKMCENESNQAYFAVLMVATLYKQNPKSE